MQGCLYDLCAYPGAIPSTNPAAWVRGDLFELNTPETMLATLDAYEGERFCRAPQRVYLGPNEQLAWVYLFCGTPPGARILNGVWPHRAKDSRERD